VSDSTKIFQSLTVPLYSIGGSLPPGQYQFPFSFQLPDNIPGSFDLTQSGYSARVRYSLAAILVTNARNNLKHKTDLIVSQRPELTNYNLPASSTQKVCMLCIPKGQCSMECNFQSDTYKPGDRAFVFCQTDNTRCSAPINTLQLGFCSI